MLWSMCFPIRCWTVPFSIECSVSQLDYGTKIIDKGIYISNFLHHFSFTTYILHYILCLTLFWRLPVICALQCDCNDFSKFGRVGEEYVPL